jgi:hypothetical protein
MMRLLSALLAILLLAGCGGQPGGLQQARVQVQADLPVAEAWQLLSDFSLAHNYVPGLTRTEIVSAQTSGVGAHRRVYDADGDYLEETITAWEQGRGFTIRLHDGDAPMAPFEQVFFDYRLDGAGSDSTAITLSLRFAMPWGGLGAWLGDTFILPAMTSELVQVAAGMKAFYETGRPASDADRERLAPQVVVSGDAVERP